MRFRPTPLGEIARHVGGRVEGDAALVIERPATLEQAGPGEIAFLANPRYAHQLPHTRAAAVIVDLKEAGAPPGASLLRTDKPYLAFARTVQLLCVEDKPPAGVMAGAVVHPAARVDPSATVMPGAYVGAETVIGANTVLYPTAVVLERCRVGRDCLLYPAAVVREDCILGDRVILHNSASIGADGFGFAQEGTRHVKIPQVGWVVIGDDVEIGANSCVDRAAMGPTTVGRGTKIDDLVMVGHGCQIGEDVILPSGVGIAGSSRLGDRVVFGGRAAMINSIGVGADSIVYSRAHVTKTFPERSIVSGNPARPHRQQLRQEANLARMDLLIARVKALEAQAAAAPVKPPRPKPARKKAGRKKLARTRR